MHDSVPFLDLVTPHVELEEELTSVFRRTLQTASFIGGPMVEEFEEAFAAFCDARHAIAISSGTDALRFAIMACGVQPGDVVVTVPHTFIATTEAISQAGAMPEFVEPKIEQALHDMRANKSIRTRDQYQVVAIDDESLRSHSFVCDFELDCGCHLCLFEACVAWPNATRLVMARAILPAVLTKR